MSPAAAGAAVSALGGADAGAIGGAVIGGGLSNAKPTGQYVDEMVGPGAWPEIGEEVFLDRKEALTVIRTAINESRTAWSAIRALIFNGLYVWVGDSATAAAAKTDKHSKAMEEHEKQLADAIKWCQSAADNIGAVKSAIRQNVANALNEIYKLISEAENSDTDATDAVRQTIDETYAENKVAIQSLADRLSGKGGVAESPAYQPYDNNGDGNSDQSGKSGQNESSANVGLGPGGGTSGSTKTGVQAVDDSTISTFAPSGRPSNGPKSAVEASDVGEVDPIMPHAGADEPAPQKSGVDPTDAAVVNRPPSPPVAAHSPGAPSTTVKPGGPAAPVPGAPGAPGAPSAPSLGGGAPSASAPSAPSSPLSASSPAASATPTGLDPSQAAAAANAQPFGPQSPAQQFAQGLSQGLNNAPPPTMQPAGTSVAPPVTDAPAAPPSTTAGASGGGTGHAPVAPPTSTGAGGSSMGGGMGGMPLGPPPTAPPAGPSAPAPPPSAAPIANTSTPATAAAAAIPVSTARAERDAALAAARAGALRRKAGDHDPLSMARRLAAALNAPGMVNDADYKFFWITGLTVDGKIVVANNYGLAYIPEQVHLPEQVHMASADESISPAERASWVNEPVVAVQRWAEHHDTELRAVIATAEQFKNSDAGVHQEVLTPEDIPASGKMAGRDRLQVIAPQASSQLAQINDTDLVNVLPPALADVNPPEDRRTALWDKVWQPLASRSSKRGARHLRAFVEYAAHTQEQAIYAAHTAADPEDQRRAVNEFVYWQHVGQLTADAIAT